MAKTNVVATLPIQASEMDLSGLKFISFSGRDGTGSCAAQEARVGDLVLKVVGLTYGALGVCSDFESTISIGDQIQQIVSGDLSSWSYLAVLVQLAEEEGGGGGGGGGPADLPA